ncbi:hypothetical protein EYF80_051163 [Liparis tanakae]|uniref:Uncharacterized protein n=1 Tax=Liparis tanakae TaxID=230148 RepID=A0A4Z2FD24_9TELE|nr:hypothetical protein EYF80_051163 [Liparis tanakae]
MSSCARVKVVRSRRCLRGVSNKRRREKKKKKKSCVIAVRTDVAKWQIPRKNKKESRSSTTARSGGLLQSGYDGSLCVTGPRGEDLGLDLLSGQSDGGRVDGENERRSSGTGDPRGGRSQAIDQVIVGMQRSRRKDEDHVQGQHRGQTQYSQLERSPQTQVLYLQCINK